MGTNEPPGIPSINGQGTPGGQAAAGLAPATHQAIRARFGHQRRHQEMAERMGFFSAAADLGHFRPAANSPAAKNRYDREDGEGPALGDTMAVWSDEQY
jgi:hypothetical protein